MSKKLQKEAREFVLSIIDEYREAKQEPELTIFIKSVSRSGMSRKMKVLIGSRDVSWYINDLLEYSHSKGMRPEYVNVGGCGMDMAFWLADTITAYLYDGVKKPDWLTGNGGGCLRWNTIY